MNNMISVSVIRGWYRLNARSAYVLIAWLAAIAINASAQATESRIALVIGNAAYRAQPLKNPVNDAKDVAAALRSVGFEVIERENTSLRDLVSAMSDFSVRAKNHHVRLLYFAGHGMQVKGRNYLIPIDAEIASQDEVPRKSADLNDLVDRLGEIRNGVNLFILDACRTNPFNNTPALTADGRRIIVRGADSDLGLAKVDAPLGTLIAYATAPGAVAIDSGIQRNSVYTKHLLRNFSVAGQPIEQMLKRIRISVASETQNLQIPWEASSLMSEFCFRPGAAGGCGL